MASACNIKGTTWSQAIRVIYSLAPSEHIDTGKTWPVYTVQLHTLGRRACIWHIVQCMA